MPPSPPPRPSEPPRFHRSTATAPPYAPGTVTVRLANVPEAEWQLVRAFLEGRGWRAY